MTIDELRAIAGEPLGNSLAARRKARTMRVIESPEISESVCIDVLGWKWLSYIGLPTRDTEGYPEECRVRRFFPPKTLESDDWTKYLSERDVREANGTEPLAYCYCSSNGPAIPPRILILIDD